jgi:hypothetical protein
MPKMELSQSFVKNITLEEGAKSVDYFDQRLTGLLLKVLNSGRKTYYIRFKDHRGNNAQRKIGNATVLNLSEARRLARRYLAEINMGVNPFTLVSASQSLRSKSLPSTTTFPT